ncbi:auxin-responsive protein IAA9-like [Andrographis paniculata]|uniref:auxin-responsive protein IAA9-like n=1 Tax=Andrographis paniculata TaxID=175694 RepID=UPI0021E92C6A|nr:auxin-responsive protein IAA9-like [Andrographis paniculata]
MEDEVDEGESMELELGLAPPCSSSSDHNHDLDLNCTEPLINHLHHHHHHNHHSQSQSQSQQRYHCWRIKQQEKHDDGDHQNHNQEFCEEEEEEIEGWPPINYSSIQKEVKTKMQMQMQIDEHMIHGGNCTPPSISSSSYVKVKMEGVGIGRKIDLALYHSYPSLSAALIHMFAKYNEMNKNSSASASASESEYRILYKDREGDWMLLGDVPWEMFVESVQRMEILRGCN